MGVLKGRVAVVTGASEGIGAAIVRRLAAEGMRVAALARRKDKLKVLEEELRDKGYMVTGYVCDVQEDSDVSATFARIDKELGPVSVLVNNAAIGRLVDILDIDLEAATAVLNTNVLGPLRCTRQALAAMRARSIADGHIVNINSISGQRAPVREHAGVYSGSKHALRVLTESLRTDIARHKLKTRITSISPGLVKTAMTEQFRQERPELPYMVPENIADAVAYAVTAPPNVNVSEMIIDPI